MAQTITFDLETSWLELLADEFTKPYMNKLRTFLEEENRKYKIYPERKNVFKAFKLCPLDKVKVIILGQDPYHGPGQANGLCFSVPKGVKKPPSLNNIYKELKTDLGLQTPEDGSLEHWAKQGVLLLNSVLTVREKQAASHQKQGWEQFTDQVISSLNQGEKRLIFVLWGTYAQNKGKFIDSDKHVVLKTTHPSPLSAHRGFLGSKHFSKINQALQKFGQEPIKW